MIDNERRARIISLIKSEVVPAIGCTEPIAVALCVAKASRMLGCEPERITATLSANIIKNAMGVGIPAPKMTDSAHSHSPWSDMRQSPNWGSKCSAMSTAMPWVVARLWSTLRVYSYRSRMELPRNCI